MASPTCSDHLCAVASDTWFVLSAYFCAFLPWVVISNGDYITERWRTVRRTRVLARYNIAMSIIPMIYVIIYAEAQRRAHDSKELGAALAALVLDLIHFARTVWGETQLNAFVAWCKRAMDCLQAIQGTDNLVSESSESSYAEDDNTSLEDRLMVNESIVDNELQGKAVTLGFSWGKAWEGMKKGNLRPSEWLVAGNPQLFSMRWAGALLCGVGNRWWGESYLSWWSRSEVLNSFYSNELFGPRLFLESVTRDVEIGGSEPRIVSVSDEIREIGQSSTYEFGIFDRFESFIPVLETLQSSYPARWDSDNRELAVAGLSESVVLATHMGVEKLSAMRRHFDRARLPTNFVWTMAWKLLLEQCRCKPPVGSALWDMFRSLTDIPFLYRFQMVTLWDRCTNWRVLQGSAHCDIDASIADYDPDEKRLFDIEPRPTNLFEYCRTRASNRKVSRSFTLGVVMETVRTFLSEWVLSAPDVVDWEPSIPTDSFEFFTSYRFSLGDKQRMIWECQFALQSELAKKSTAHANMSSSAELIMLFILSMPVFRVEEEEEDGKSNVSNEIGVVRRGENSDTTSSRAYSSVNVSVNGYRVYSRIAPQDISVVIRFNMETRRASLSLRHNVADARFEWEYWVDAAMGYMKGLYEGEKKRGMNVGNIERTFRKVDLRKPMLELSPLYCVAGDSSTEGSPFDSESAHSLMETGIVRVWMGWPAFDVRICKFETDQWLSACNIDINNIEFDRDWYGYWENRKVDEEIGRAEETIRKVNELILLDENDERSEEEDNGISQTLH